MHANEFKSWASEVWTLMTSWWVEPEIAEKANQLINEMGQEAALAEATKHAMDLLSSPEDRIHWNKVMVCVTQELWRRNLTF